AEVDLRGTAGALDDDEVVVALEAEEAAADHRQERRLVLLVLARGHVLHRAAQDHDLGGAVGGRLEEDGVHVDAGLEAAGSRLHGGGAADLAAVPADIGVVRHVLRLEGGDAEAVLLEDAAEGGDEGGLADAAGAPLDHDGRHKRKKAHLPQSREAAPSSLRFPADGRPFSGAPSTFAQAGLLAPGSRSRAFPLSQWPRAYSSSYSGGTAPE